MIINGDSLHELKELDDESIDLVVTDPPYGYSFMGKDWDKAVPSVQIWQECLRVLKPGAFCFVMSAPRSDVQNAMISRLMEAGFRLDFTPIYWTYASGFPKAGDTAKLVDKRLGVEPKVIGTQKLAGTARRMKGGNFGDFGGEDTADVINLTEPVSEEAKALKGSKLGFQPKPAVEVIIVAMKPLSEKTYVDQALKNGKGITWLDDCRIGTSGGGQNGTGGSKDRTQWRMSAIPKTTEPVGRFPANLLVSDDVLNDGVEHKGGSNQSQAMGIFGNKMKDRVQVKRTSDSGSYSRYFDLDKWYGGQHAQMVERETAQETNSATHRQGTGTSTKSLPQEVTKTLPFLIVPKASKSEKNKGLEHLPTRLGGSLEGGNDKRKGDRPQLQPTKNVHPTVKPLKLMSYLITLGSRPGDTVLDPFVGSGTTVVAAKQLGREGIGIEREPEYADIARARVAHLMPQLPPEQPPLTLEDKVLASEVIHNYHEQMRLI